MGKVIQLMGKAAEKNLFKEHLIKTYGEVIRGLSDEDISEVASHYAQDILNVLDSIELANTLVTEFVEKATKKLGNPLIICAMLDFIANTGEKLNIEKTLPTDDENILLYEKVITLVLDKKLTDSLRKVMENETNKNVSEE